MAIIIVTSSMTLAIENIQRSTDNNIIAFSNNNNKDNTNRHQKIIYKYVESNKKITVFTDKKPKPAQAPTAYQILKIHCFACHPDKNIDWRKVKLNLMSYRQLIETTAQKYHLETALIRAIIHVESAFNAKATSIKGAQGLMQIMPNTAKQLKITDAFNAQQNIEGGTKYLAQLLQQFNGKISLASAAYNAGPTTVKKYNGIPPYPETKVYVDRVNILYRRYQLAQ